MKFALLTILLISSSAWAGRKVALVKVLRGSANVWIGKQPTAVKLDDWIEDGAVIKTAEKSFVKLIFVDKSQMNIGPNSLMKIESFKGNDAGVIDLVKGKIRSQVTKDYLQIQDKTKSKLFIKTKNAVMGVRGTDFLITTNGKNTSTVLFEGEIAFNKLTEKGQISTERLEAIVDSGIRMFPGEFSVMEQDRLQPTIPALLNIQQREALEKNDGSSSDRAPSSAKVEPVHSVVPPGLDGKAVSNEAQVIKDEVAKAQVDHQPHRGAASVDPEGFVKDGVVKPANGSFVHLESGTIVPPGPGSVLDKNSNTYIPGSEAGKVAADGSYVPPKNIEISQSGQVVTTATPDAAEKPKLPTVVQEEPKKSRENDILNNFVPGGLYDYQRLGGSGGSASSSNGGSPVMKGGGGIDPSVIPGSNTGLNIGVTR